MSVYWHYAVYLKNSEQYHFFYIVLAMDNTLSGYYDEPFLRPRLVGKRFETHTIPLDFLGDLSVLRDILVEIAKEEYRHRYPESKRVPSDFSTIGLGLSSIEPGSAIPVINIVPLNSTRFINNEAISWFEKARETFVTVIVHAEKGISIVEILTQKAIRLFKRFGRGLKEDETIEFYDCNDVCVARYDKSIGKRIFSESLPSLVHKKIVTRGYVTEVDRHKKTWKFMLNDGKEVSAPLEGVFLDDICDALKKYVPGSANNPRVSLKGEAEILGTEIRTIKSIDDIVLLNLLNIESQLDDLRLLKAGWYDGNNGKSFSGQDLDWLAATWERLQPDHVELPHIYPTPSGEVQAEWTFGQYEILVRIDMGGRRGRWYCMNMDDLSEEYDEEHDLDLEQVEAWKWLFQRISNLQAKLV